MSWQHLHQPCVAGKVSTLSLSLSSQYITELPIKLPSTDLSVNEQLGIVVKQSLRHDEPEKFRAFGPKILDEPPLSRSPVCHKRDLLVTRAQDSSTADSEGAAYPAEKEKEKETRPLQRRRSCHHRGGALQWRALPCVTATGPSGERRERPELRARGPAGVGQRPPCGGAALACPEPHAAP